MLFQNGTIRSYMRRPYPAIENEPMYSCVCSAALKYLI